MRVIKNKSSSRLVKTIAASLASVFVMIAATPAAMAVTVSSDSGITSAACTVNVINNVNQTNVISTTTNKTVDNQITYTVDKNTYTKFAKNCSGTIKVDTSKKNKGIITIKSNVQNVQGYYRIKAPSGNIYYCDIKSKGTSVVTLTEKSGTYYIELMTRKPGEKYTLSNHGSIKIYTGTYALLDTIKIKAKITGTTRFIKSNSILTYTKKYACVKKAKKLCANQKSTIKKIVAMESWVAKNIKYDTALNRKIVKNHYVRQPVLPSVTYKTRKGICSDFAALFATMCRSQGIPCKIVTGYHKGTCHSWNEVYVKKAGKASNGQVFKKGWNRIDTTFMSTMGYSKKTIQKLAKDKSYSKIERIN